MTTSDTERARGIAYIVDRMTLMIRCRDWETRWATDAKGDSPALAVQCAIATALAVAREEGRAEVHARCKAGVEALRLASECHHVDQCQECRKRVTAALAEWDKEVSDG